MLMLGKIKYNPERIPNTDLILKEGSEANVFIDKRSGIVYKEWTVRMIPTIPNKIAKLEAMSEIKELDNHMVETNSIVEYRIRATGYIMPLKNLESPSFYDWDLSKKIPYLYNFKDTIKFFKEIGLHYTDFSPYNMYIEDNKIKLLDKDNVSFNGRKSDLYSIFLKRYIEFGGKENDKAMIYAYNFFTFLCLSKRFQYRFYLEELKQDPSLFRNILENKEVEEFIKKLLEDEIDNVTDHEVLIDRFKK